MLFSLALFLSAVLHNPFPAHAAPPPVRLGRLDQMSRQLVVRGLRPGQRYEILANGRLFGAGTARSTVEAIRLRSPFRPGTLITVVSAGPRGSVIRTTGSVQNDYLQYHYDVAHTGWNQNEVTLNLSNVTATTFGHLFSLPVDGFVLAQPLYMSQATVGGTTHNAVIVATENDSIYTFDTDTGQQIWQQNYANPSAGAVPIPTQAVRATDIAPVVGITSTPAIDPNTNIIYFVAAIQQDAGGGSFTYHQFLHAVNLNDGTDVPGSPVDITATALLNNGKPAPFDPLRELNRASMLLANGIVYASFGSHNDVPGGKPHGWIFAYDATSLSLLYFLNTTTDVTNRYYACIWAAGWGPVVDEFGNVYVGTGDGAFDADSGGHNWGDSVLKMTNALSITDSFTPQDQAVLTQQDHDLGGGGVLILPDQPGTLPHLAVIAGLEGTIYLLNRDGLGGYTPGGPDNVVQEMPTELGTVRGGPGYYAGPTGTFLYYCGNGNSLRAYQLQTSPSTQLVFSSQAVHKCGTGGAIPTVTSNGATPNTGIVWMTNRPGDKSSSQVQLFAYDATNLQHKLYQASVAYWTNLHSQPFLTPTAIDGRVFVGTPNSVEEFGLIGTRSGVRRPSIR